MRLQQPQRTASTWSQRTRGIRNDTVDDDDVVEHDNGACRLSVRTVSAAVDVAAAEAAKAAEAAEAAPAAVDVEDDDDDGGVVVVMLVMLALSDGGKVGGF